MNVTKRAASETEGGTKKKARSASTDKAAEPRPATNTTAMSRVGNLMVAKPPGVSGRGGKRDATDSPASSVLYVWLYWCKCQVPPWSESSLSSKGF